MSGASGPAAPAAATSGSSGRPGDAGSSDLARPLPPNVRLGPAPRALYLHFPFCAHRCHYCDFSVKRSARPPMEGWLAAVRTELAWWFERAGWEPGAPLDTVFLGGGTPSLVGVEGAAGLRDVLAAYFVLEDPAIEWTAEANPASFDLRLGEAWRAAGVNRVSLGVQALDDAVLAWLGRLHDRRRAEEAVAAARAAGFERINIDLLFALPDEVERDLERETEALLELDVTHVSLYGLTIEPRTPLARWVRLGRARPATGGRYAEEYRRLSRTLVSAGFEHYEVSNFARPGDQCRHNWYYWNRRPYLGIGPSAHGFLPPHRTWNVFRWDRYERALGAGAGPLEGWERVGPFEEALERIWLELRTTRGVRTRPDRPGADRAFRRFQAAGWLEPRGDRWVATAEGWLRMDSIVTEIAEEEERWRSLP